MSDAELDPHVLVSARLSRHPKMIDLPSDAARFGWVHVLGEAKLQRPPGQFASRRVLEVCAGRFAKYVGDWLTVGLLEYDGSAVHVHDWEAHQERGSRTQRWRQSVGLTSGHGNLSGNTGETDGETPGKQPRAGARVMQSHSQSTTTGEGSGEGADPAWLTSWFQTGHAYLPTQKQQAVIDAYLRAFDVTGDQRLAGVFLRHPSDPIAGLKSDLEAFRAERRMAADQDEADHAGRADNERRAKANRILLAAYHNNGAHVDAPNPDCPECGRSAE